MHLFATTTSEQVLELGKLAAIIEVEPQTPSGKSSGPARSRKH